VPDPYDSLSPNHDWGPVLLDARAAAKALGVPGDLLDLQVTPGPSGHAEDVEAVGSKGSVALTGSAVRAALGLRSTWFIAGWLALTPPPAPVAFGASLSLSGTVRGVDGVSLEQRMPDGTWQTVA